MTVLACCILHVADRKKELLPFLQCLLPVFSSEGPSRSKRDSAGPSRSQRHSDRGLIKYLVRSTRVFVHGSPKKYAPVSPFSPAMRVDRSVTVDKRGLHCWPVRASCRIPRHGSRTTHHASRTTDPGQRAKYYRTAAAAAARPSATQSGIPTDRNPLPATNSPPCEDRRCSISLTRSI